jgi:hypothetical protein
MKPKEIEALESYFKTDSEHWNKFTFEMLCEILQQGIFENPELPLQLFTEAEDIFTKNHEKPLQAVEQFAGELNKHKLSPTQKLFLYEWVYKYLKNTEYDNLDLSQIKDLLESQKDKIEADNQPAKPLSTNIRGTLKDLMQKELDNLPDTLKGLEPVQRLNILCKLIPYVLPKVDSVHHEHGE